MKNSVNVSLSYSKKANEAMKDVIRKAKDYDTDVEQVFSNCWEWFVGYANEDFDLEETDPVEELIIYSFNDAGIPSDEFYFEYDTND